MKNARKIRIISLLMSIILCITIISACGESDNSQNTQPTSDSDQTTEDQSDNLPYQGIDVLVNLNQPPDALRDEFDVWYDHLKQRCLEELGVNLEIEMVSWGDYLNKHLMSIANSDGPDIIQMGSGVPSVIAAANGLLDLTSYMDQFGGLDVYFPVAQYYAQYNNEVIAIPWGGGGRVTYYNKNIYDSAGLEYPENDWSWEEFVSDIDTLTEHMGKPAYTVQGAANDVTYNFWANIVTDGGSILTTDEKSAAFNDDVGVRSVRKIIDLYDNGYLPASFAESTLDDNLAAFINEEVALAYGSASWWMDVIQVLDQDEFGMVTMPTGSTGKTTGAVTMSEFGVMKYSDNPDAAVAALAIIASREETLTSNSILGWVPFRNDLVDDPAFTEYPFFETFFHNAQNSILYIPQVATVSTILSSSTKTLNDIFAEVVTGAELTDDDIKQRLDILADEVNSMLEDNN